MGCCQSESRHIDADSYRNGSCITSGAPQGENMNSTIYEELKEELRKQQCIGYSSYRRVKKQLSQIHESEPQMEYSVLHIEQSLIKSLKGSPLCHSDDVPSEGSFDNKFVHMFDGKELFVLDNQLYQKEQMIPYSNQDALNTGMVEETIEQEEEFGQIINEEKNLPKSGAHNNEKYHQEQSTQVVESINHETVLEQDILGDCIEEGELNKKDLGF